MRASITTAVESGRDSTVDALDERFGTRLDESATGIEERLRAHLENALAELGVTQLRRSLAEVSAQVVEHRGDARAISESISALDERVQESSKAALAPVVRSVDQLREQVGAIRPPDLGPVAAQLARLSATIVSQTRHQAASPDDVALLRTSLDEALQALRSELAEQASATQRTVADLTARRSEEPDAEELIAGLQRSLGELMTRQIREVTTRLEGGPDTAELISGLHRSLSEQITQQIGELTARLEDEPDSTAVVASLQRTLSDQLSQQISEVQEAWQSGLERLSTELAAPRAGADRRAARWRRGGGSDEPGAAAAPAVADLAEVERRIDEAFHAVDVRLGSLAQLIERATAFADDAAQAASAALQKVSALPAPASAPAPVPTEAAAKKATPKKAAAKDTAATKATAKKTTAKKVTAKKAVTKKAAATKAAAKKPTRRAAPLQATPPPDPSDG
jgi:hypothetical protein